MYLFVCERYNISSTNAFVSITSVATASWQNYLNWGRNRGISQILLALACLPTVAVAIGWKNQKPLLHIQILTARQHKHLKRHKHIYARLSTQKEWSNPPSHCLSSFLPFFVSSRVFRDFFFLFRMKRLDENDDKKENDKRSVEKQNWKEESRQKKGDYSTQLRCRRSIVERR